jgi:hypothetical protein
MDVRRLRALVIGGTAAATLAVGGVVAADPLPSPPSAPAAPAPDPTLAALTSLEAKAARDLAQAQAAARNLPARVVTVTQPPPAAAPPAPAVTIPLPPPVAVTQAPPVTQSSSS